MANIMHIQNNERFNRANIPHLGFDSFRKELLDLAAKGGQIVQFFAYEDQDRKSVV